jgi:hypothetical protein
VIQGLRSLNGKNGEAKDRNPYTTEGVGGNMT